MTIGTFTLFAFTGSLVVLKLAVMVLAVVLLARTLSSGRQKLAPRPVLARQPQPGQVHH